MRSLINAVAISVLLLTGLFAAPTGRADHLAPVSSVDEVLEAHNFFQGPDAISDWTADARKWTAYYSESSGKLLGFFERRVSVARAGAAFKRYKADPLGIRQQVDLFDGKSSSRLVIERGRLVEEGELIDDSRIRGVEFSVNTFGLIPILHQLAGPVTEVTYAGRTTQGQYMLKVLTASGSWTIYVDQSRLIRRVEMQDRALEYEDYYQFEGVWLPLTQKMFFKGRLFYELFFTRIDPGRSSLPSTSAVKPLDTGAFDTGEPLNRSLL